MSIDCFTCPQPANYAAIALQLQKTAFDAENCIYPLEAQLRAAANRSTVVNVTSSLQAVSFATRTTIAFSNLTCTFSNSETSFLSSAPPPGIYHVGIWLNATAAGAVTDNSFRQLEIVTRPLLAPSVVPDDTSVSLVIFESNNGNGMDMGLDTLVTLDGLQAIRFEFLHANAGSAVNIAAGAIVWWTKISDLEIPRVVI